MALSHNSSNTVVMAASSSSRVHKPVSSPASSRKPMQSIKVEAASSADQLHTVDDDDNDNNNNDNNATTTYRQQPATTVPMMIDHDIDLLTPSRPACERLNVNVVIPPQPSYDAAFFAQESHPSHYTSAFSNIDEKNALDGFFLWSNLVMPVIEEADFRTRVLRIRSNEALIRAIACRGITCTMVPERKLFEKFLSKQFLQLYMRQRQQAAASGHLRDDIDNYLDSLTALALMIDFAFEKEQWLEDNLIECHFNLENLVREVSLFKQRTKHVITSETAARLDKLQHYVYCLVALQFRDVEAAEYLLRQFGEDIKHRSRNQLQEYSTMIFFLAKTARNFFESCTNSTRAADNVCKHVQATYVQLQRWSSCVLRHWIQQHNIQVGDHEDVHTIIVTRKVLCLEDVMRETRLRIAYVKILEISCYYHIWKYLRVHKGADDLSMESRMLIVEGECYTTKAILELITILQSMKDKDDGRSALWLKVGPISIGVICRQYLDMLRSNSRINNRTSWPLESAAIKVLEHVCRHDI